MKKETSKNTESKKYVWIIDWEAVPDTKAQAERSAMRFAESEGDEGEVYYICEIVGVVRNTAKTELSSFEDYTKTKGL